MSIVKLRFNTKTLHTHIKDLHTHAKTYTHTKDLHTIFNVEQNALTGFKEVFMQVVTLIRKSFPGIFLYFPGHMKGEY